MAKKKWIQSAIKNPGSFTRAAKRSKMSPAAFAERVLSPKSKSSPTMKRRARLYRTLRKINRKR